MGKKALKQAQKLGYIELPRVTLYGRPKHVKETFSGFKSDITSIIRDHLTFQDPQLVHSGSGGSRNHSDYFLSEQLKLFIQVTEKMAGMGVYRAINHVIMMEFYTENEKIIREIASLINKNWEDGILANMDWKKIKKKFKVDADECIAEWNKWLQ